MRKTPNAVNIMEKEKEGGTVEGGKREKGTIQSSVTHSAPLSCLLGFHFRKVMLKHKVIGEMGKHSKASSISYLLSNISD